MHGETAVTQIRVDEGVILVANRVSEKRGLHAGADPVVAFPNEGFRSRLDFFRSGGEQGAVAKRNARGYHGEHSFWSELDLKGSFRHRDFFFWPIVGDECHH